METSEAQKVIREHHKSGKTYQEIADIMNKEGLTTVRGLSWSANHIAHVARMKLGIVKRYEKISQAYDEALKHGAML